MLSRPVSPLRGAIVAVAAAFLLSGCSLLDRDSAQESDSTGGPTEAVTSVAAGVTTADLQPAGDPEASQEVAAGAQTPPPTDSMPGPAVAQEADTASLVVAEADDERARLNAQLEAVLANQATLNRRLDQLAASGAVTPSVTPGAASQGAQLQENTAGGAQGVSTAETLGEARTQFKNFGMRTLWSVVVLVVFNLGITGLVWVLDALAERNARRRLFYKRLVPVLRILLWIFAAYLIIRVIFQINAQGIVAAAAAVGVAVGFAAQDLLKNLFGGFILVFDQPFQAGDKISVGGTYGEVVSIGLRSTRIVTADDNLVSVPNAQVVDQQVANANAGELNCQVVTDLYLPGWADEAAAKRIAFEAAAGSRFVYLNKPIVVLVSDVFKETFLTRVRVKAYVLDPRFEFQFQSDVTERARSGFRDAGLLKPENMRYELVDRSAVGTAPTLSGHRGATDDA